MLQYLWVFCIGGALCAIAQILIDLTKLTPARILVSYVVCGVILTGVGLYGPLVDFAGAGATVPISGFGYLLAEGAIKGSKNGLFGAFTGGLASASAGITAAIVFGYLNALIFKPKSKKN